MPSKEESGKIFGIASVSLAQSSGPDNTKCTLGKCGSIHKPVLGPVVPTEGYFGDQLSSKERRKAKVNMTHEQIQKWLIECSSNPDEIQDDLDDDFDDSLRPQQSTTPPPTRDDKELSASFSSSSKNTRGDLGKSESAWSAKGPSLKATPVLVTPPSRKEQQELADGKDCDGLDYDKSSTPVNLTQKMTCNESTTVDKKVNDRKGKELVKTAASKAAAQPRSAAATPPTPISSTPTPVSLTPTKSSPTPPPVIKQKPEKGKRNAAGGGGATSIVSPPAAPTPPNPKRTPVYNQKNAKAQQQQAETKPAANPPTASGAKRESVYAFGKEEDTSTKTGNRRRAEPSQVPAPAPVSNALSERSPTKKRAAAAAAATAVQLTLSPTENCKIEGKPKAAVFWRRQH